MSDGVVDEAMSSVSKQISSITGVALHRLEASGVDVATVILERSIAHDIDLIVLGTRAESASTARLGSVSSSVVTLATQPVLLVPPRMWHAEEKELLP